MSKIDTGQTVEEAALEAALFEDYYYNEDLQPHYIKGFERGAEWQAKQYQWISVKDRLPPPGEEVLLFDINSIRHLVLGWLRENKGYNKSMWALSNGHVDDEDITHWMIIPENHG